MTSDIDLRPSLATCVEECAGQIVLGIGYGETSESSELADAQTWTATHLN